MKAALTHLDICSILDMMRKCYQNYFLTSAMVEQLKVQTQLPSAADTNKRVCVSVHVLVCVCARAPPLFSLSLLFFPCQTSVRPPAAKPANRSLKGVLSKVPSLFPL